MSSQRWKIPAVLESKMVKPYMDRQFTSLPMRPTRRHLGLTSTNASLRLPMLTTKKEICVQSTTPASETWSLNSWAASVPQE